MATIVLTAAGTAIGGPIGGAIGALIGQRIDHALFAPAAREGPRLTELTVQTSSYGSAIPWLFGAMRVAGTVIWSTDLVELRGGPGGTGGKGGGGGARRTGYAASFAVLLSGRPVRAIGRIWADGMLVRGAAGDLKVAGALRLHRGEEDQPVDPLIASAEGAAPAYRGCAYLVCEHWPLERFGNRIPSLTVELFADDGAVTVDAVARAFGAEGGGARLDGFAASGSVRGVLEVLGQADGGDWAAAGDGLRLRGDDGAVATIADDGAAVAGGKDARARRLAAATQVPAAVTVRHYDPARDYQAGVQRAGLPGPAAAIDLPVAIDADAAKAVAAMLLTRGAARERRTVTLGFAGMTIAPGDRVAVAGEAGRWRVIEAAVEGMAVRLVLAPAIAAAPVLAASSGQVAGAPDRVVGRTLLVAAELPPPDGALLTVPRLLLVAAGTGSGWRGAGLLWSADDGERWTEAGRTAAPGTIGTVERAPAPAPATLVDAAGVLVVRLARADMVLAEADDAALDQGANLACVGGEWVQFGRAERLDARRWRLTRLLRGRRGTEGGGIAAGDGFALIDRDHAAAIDLPGVAAGQRVRVLASGVGDPDPAEAVVEATGASLRPPAPVHPRWHGPVLAWVRRSRNGWAWQDGVDAPLGEEREAYRVTIHGPAGARDIATDRPDVALEPGMLAGATRIEVRQRGTWAESPPLVVQL